MFPIEESEFANERIRPYIYLQNDSTVLVTSRNSNPYRHYLPLIYIFYSNK